MKLKELLDIMRSAREENTTFTLVDYEIYDYLDGSEKETICSFSSDLKPKCFLTDSILESEVIGAGIKSETEMVFELAHDWNEEKEEPKVTDVKIPSRILEVSITKNELGLADVLIKDLKENEMLDIIQYLCEYTGTEAIFDKDGKWTIPLTTDEKNEGGDDDDEEQDLSSS
jgi:hypothetical protein